MTTTLPRERAKSSRGTADPRPMKGDAFVHHTDPETGRDVLAEIERVWRQNDCPEIWTVGAEARRSYWIRWDAVRRQWVRAYGQQDGEAVPVSHQ